MSFSLCRTNAENGSSKIQEFLAKIETIIREHPLWVHAADAEIENALEEIYLLMGIYWFSSYIPSCYVTRNNDKKWFVIIKMPPAYFLFNPQVLKIGII